MADRRMTFALLLAAASAGCSTKEIPLLLDVICRGTYQDLNNHTSSPACRVDGDAEETTGITGDSYAVHLGPSTGTLYIKVGMIVAVMQSTWSFDVLAASTAPEGNTLYRTLTWGSCANGCPGAAGDVQAQLKEDFQWAKVVENLPGTTGTYAPVDAELGLRGADIDIVDVRTPGYDGSYDDYFPGY